MVIEELIKVRGLKGVRPKDTDDGLHECFQGFFGSAESGTEKSDVEQEGDDLKGIMNEFLSKLSDTRDAMAQEYEQAEANGENPRSIFAILPAYSVIKWIPGALLPVLDYLMKNQGAIINMSQLIQALESIINIYQDIRDEVRSLFLESDSERMVKAMERVGGRDEGLIRKERRGILERAFLRRNTDDEDVSLFAAEDPETGELVPVFEKAFLGIEIDEQEKKKFVSNLARIAENMNDLAMRDVVIRVGDNLAVHIKAQMLEYS